MTFGRLILLGLLGLVVAEAGVFLLVARAIGWFGAMFAMAATSVLGMLVLGRMGKRLAGRLADMLSRRDIGVAEAGSSGFLTMTGGLLLILPGFITDLAGLLLLIPAVQRKLIDMSPIRRSRQSGNVLELDRSQWRDLPEKRIPDDQDKRPKR